MRSLGVHWWQNCNSWLHGKLPYERDRVLNSKLFAASSFFLFVWRLQDICDWSLHKMYISSAELGRSHASQVPCRTLRPLFHGSFRHSVMNKCVLFSAQAHPCLRAARILLSCPPHSRLLSPNPIHPPTFRYLIALIQFSSLLSFGPSIQAHVWELTALSHCSCQHPLNWIQVGWIPESQWTLTPELASYQQLFSPCPQWSSGSQTISQCVSERGQIETTKIQHDLNKHVHFQQVSIKVSEPFEDLMASGSVLSENYTVPGLDLLD